MKVEYYHVQSPDLNATFIGQCKPSSTPGLLLLCTPDGRPLFELPSEYVTPSTPEDVAKRLAADQREAQRRIARN